MFLISPNEGASQARSLVWPLTKYEKFVSGSLLNCLCLLGVKRNDCFYNIVKKKQYGDSTANVRPEGAHEQGGTIRASSSTLKAGFGS